MQENGLFKIDNKYFGEQHFISSPKGFTNSVYFAHTLHPSCYLPGRARVSSVFDRFKRGMAPTDVKVCHLMYVRYTNRELDE